MRELEFLLALSVQTIQERREIADFIKSNHIGGVCILHGDSHMLAADDGSNSDYATGGGAPIPVMCAAPLDRDPSIKGGPYSQGVYRVTYAPRRAPNQAGTAQHPNDCSHEALDGKYPSDTYTLTRTSLPKNDPQRRLTPPPSPPDSP